MVLPLIPLAFGIGGAVAGSAIGVGAAIGFAVGSLIGNFLFGGQAVEGARLSDLDTMNSEYGSFIPIPFATVRVPAHIIWGQPIKEVSKTEKKGSVFGLGGSKVTTYEYFGRFAVSLGEGPATEVLRVWGDGKIIYENPRSSDGELGWYRSSKGVTGTSMFRVEPQLSDYNPGSEGRRLNKFITFYPGSETQGVDPYMASFDGTEDNTIDTSDSPAYRGQAILVFQEMPLKDFGNRVPNITVEVSHETSQEVAQNYTNTTGKSSSSSFPMMPDWDNGHIYRAATDNSIRVYSIINMTELLSTKPSSGKSGVMVSTYNNWAVVPGLGGFIYTYDDIANYVPMFYHNPFTGVTSSFGSESIFGPHGSGGFRYPVMMVAQKVPRSGGGYNYFGFVMTQQQTIGVVEISKSGSISYVWDHDDLDLGSDPRCMAPGRVGLPKSGTPYGEDPQHRSEVWLCLENGRIYKWTVSAVTRFSAVLGIAESLDFELMHDYSGSEYAQMITLDKTDGHMIVFVEDAETPTRIEKRSSEDFSLIWSKSLSFITGSGSGDGDYSAQYSEVGNGLMFIATSTSAGVLVNTLDGSTIANYSGLSSFSNWMFNTAQNMVTATTGGTMKNIFLDRGNPQGVSLSSVVEALCEKVGYDAANDLDTTELSSDLVEGFVVTRLNSLRSSLDLLAIPYLFQGIASDFKVKFQKRSQSVVRTIDADDLVFIDEDTGSTFKETRQQEVELPERVEIAYMERESDYENGLQTAKRIRNPSPSHRSREVTPIELPMVLSADKAKQTAEISLYEAWVTRHGGSWGLGWKHIDLDPGDVITINTPGGDAFTQRVNQADIGADLSVDMQGVDFDSGSYVSNAVGDPGNPLPQSLPGFNLTQTFILDIPLLNWSHEPTSGLLAYGGLSGYGQPNWEGATLFESVDDVVFEQLGERSSVNELVQGITTTTLGDVADPWLTDNTNTVTIRPISGSVSDWPTITEAQLLNGLNMVLIGDEIIRYQTATDNGDGTITLSILIRGRRGTENETGSHSAGERVVFLDQLDLIPVPALLSLLNSDKYYKGVGYGEDPANAASLTHTFLGTSNMPYAPVHCEASVSSGDIVLTWVRRSRAYDRQFEDGTEDVPLHEDSEEYEVDVHLSSNDSVVRTFSGLTSPTVTYTSAQRSTDGVGLDEVYFKVYQISARVGRGVSSVRFELEEFVTEVLNILNPSAEDNSGHSTTPDNWSVLTGDFLVHGGSAGDGTTARTGSYFFYAGNTALSRGYQDVAVNDVDMRATIDASAATLTYEYYQSCAGADRQRVYVEFYDDMMGSLGNYVPPYASDGGANNWVKKEHSVAVPTGTRTIRFICDMDRQAGTSNDGYTEDISAFLYGPRV